jgi:hypothetical protein
VRLFNLGNVNSILQQLPLAGVLFVIPVFLQQVTGVSAIMTGVALLPLSITVFLLSFYGGKLLAFFRDPKYVIIAGFIIAAAGALVLRGEFSLATEIKDLVFGLAVFGAGTGLLLSQLTNVTMSAAGAEREADSSGLLNMSKNLGYSLGTALIGILLVIGVFSGLVSAIEESPQFQQMPREEIEQSLFDYFQGMQTEAPQGLPSGDTPEARQIVDSTISDAMRLAFFVLGMIMLLGAVIALFMPKVGLSPGPLS